MDRNDAAALDAADALAPFRSRFDVKDDLPIYLDGNSLGRPSASTIEAIRAGIEDWAGNLVGGWSRWIELPVAVGDRIGRLIGAGPGQVAVCDSTTVNLYKLAGAALSHLPDRRVIVADAAEFPTDRYVLEGLAAQQGKELRLVAGSVPDAIDDDTALVCLSHVNYRSGARLDLREVTERAHRHGALMLWDLCHSAGAVPVDLDGVGADLAVGCTYKYLNAGPGAPAFLYVRRDLQRALRQPIWGWFGQRNQFEMGPAYDPVDDMGRFTTGTSPVLGLLAVDAAAAVIEEAGLDALWTKSVGLTSLIIELVREHLEKLGARLVTPAEEHRRGAHVSLSHPRCWSWCSALIEEGLVVGDFRAPDVIRLGPAPLYTRYVDAHDAVHYMAEVFRSGLPEVPRGRVT